MRNTLLSTGRIWLFWNREPDYAYGSIFGEFGGWMN